MIAMTLTPNPVGVMAEHDHAVWLPEGSPCAKCGQVSPCDAYQMAEQARIAQQQTRDISEQLSERVRVAEAQAERAVAQARRFGEAAVAITIRADKAETELGQMAAVLDEAYREDTGLAVWHEHPELDLPKRYEAWLDEQERQGR